jgi:hypothetical protein
MTASYLSNPLSGVWINAPLGIGDTLLHPLKRTTANTIEMHKKIPITLLIFPTPKIPIS